MGCGVCDTPGLWRGAAGLCARVRACAGAAESLHTYVHTHTSQALHNHNQRVMQESIARFWIPPRARPPPHAPLSEKKSAQQRQRSALVLILHTHQI